MEQRLIQKQIARLSMAPKMVESIRILQMPITELRAMVEEEIQKNPLLEEADIRIDEKEKRESPEIEDEEQRELPLARPVTLQENLLRQLRIFVTSKDEVMIGEILIGNIDEDGYLQITLEEVAKELGFELSKVEAVLSLIQGFEPMGVGARDLKECLLLQLKSKDMEGSLAWQIVDSFLEDCARKQYNKISKALKVSLEEVEKAHKVISRLEPKPGRAHSNQDENHFIIPDIIIRPTGREYEIMQNGEDIPRLRINEYYRKLLKDDNTSEEVRNYIAEKISSANFIIKCIRERWETMRKITKFIVERQGEFIEKGKAFLKPVNFKDAARAVGRHESTISRAVANKYIQTPCGVFELKSLFSSRLPNGVENGEDGVSSKAVKAEIEILIKMEDRKKPLSDQKIQAVLAERGIKIARRTVAKYREELKILPSHLRKSL